MRLFAVALNEVPEVGQVELQHYSNNGIHPSSEFEKLLLSTDTPEDFLRCLDDPDFFVIDQWQLQELCKVMRKARVMMYSHCIPEGLSERLLIEMIDSVESGIADAMSTCKGNANIAVIPKGPYVLTKISE